jgi:hypothetical protein
MDLENSRHLMKLETVAGGQGECSSGRPAFAARGNTARTLGQSGLHPGSAPRPCFRMASRFRRVALAVVFLVSALHSLSAQVIPALRLPPTLAGFVMFTDTKPDLRWYGDYAVYGVSAGTIFQTPHLLGAEMRGSFLRAGGLEHQESLLGGPHVALHYGHWSPYVSVLGGAANAWRWSNFPREGLPKPRIEEGFGTEWSVAGGLDVRLHHRFTLRVAELSYSKIYLHNGTLTPITASAGLTYRIR